MLRVNRVHLTVDRVRVEQRGNEELRKDVQRLRQLAGFDRELEVGILKISICIVSSAVLINKLVVVVLLWVLLRSEEQHVL